MLVGALMLADLVWLIPDSFQRQFHRPLAFVVEEWVHAFLADALMALAGLLLFRWIRAALAAPALAALAYALVMVPVNIALPAIFMFASSSSGFHFDALALLLALSRSFVAALFFYFPLALTVPRIRPMWLGVGVGAVAGSVLASLAQTLIVLAQYGKSLVLTFGSVMTSMGYALASGLIFAAAFVGGLALLGFRPGEFVGEAGPATITGRAGEVQRAANFRMVRRQLRGAGIGSIVFGVIATVLGTASLQDSDLNVILLCLGVFLLAEGVWLLVSPSPAGMIVDGFALIALGAWNIFVTISNLSAGGHGPGGFAALGLLQIGWGFQSFIRYRRVAELPMARPDQATSDWLEAIMKSATSKDPSGDVVSFQVREKKALLNWRGKLLDEFGLFFEVKEQLAIVADRNAANITPIGSPVAGKNAPVRIALGARSWEGEIDSQNLDRFQKWKTSAK
jgi:hypothetical protein